MKAKDSASSSDEIAVFQAYIDLINSELETIWARHNALLVANSLIIGAPTISPSALWGNKWEALPPHQRRMGRDQGVGWSAMRRHADLAGTFASACFKHLPNPFAETICNRAQTRIYHLILLVIAVFVLIYLGRDVSRTWPCPSLAKLVMECLR